MPIIGNRAMPLARDDNCLLSRIEALFGAGKQATNLLTGSYGIICCIDQWNSIMVCSEQPLYYLYIDRAILHAKP